MNYSMSQKPSKTFYLYFPQLFSLNLCYFNNVLYYQTIKEIFDKFRVMSSSLMLDLINDMRQDGTYKDQEQSLVFMAM